MALMIPRGRRVTGDAERVATGGAAGRRRRLGGGNKCSLGRGHGVEGRALAQTGGADVGGLAGHWARSYRRRAWPDIGQRGRAGYRGVGCRAFESRAGGGLWGCGRRRLCHQRGAGHRPVRGRWRCREGEGVRRQNVPLVGAAAVEGRVRAQTGGADAVFCGRGCGTVVAPRRFSFWTHRVPLAHGDTALDMTGLSGESSVGLLPWATHCWRKGLAGEWGGALPGLAGIVLGVVYRSLLPGLCPGHSRILGLGHYRAWPGLW